MNAKKLSKKINDEIVTASGNSMGAAKGSASKKSTAAMEATTEAHEASGDALKSGEAEHHTDAIDAHKKASDAHSAAMVAQAKAGNPEAAKEHATMMALHDSCAEAHGMRSTDTDEDDTKVEATLKELGDVVKAKAQVPEGFCPHCAAEVESTEKNGKETNATCKNGHCFPMDAALTKAQASEKTKPTNTIRATSRDIIHCRASGSKLQTSEPWEQDKPVKFCYMPGGLHTITAGFSGPITKGREGSINLTIDVDPDRDAPVCQASMDAIKAESPKQELYGCFEHDEKQASVWANGFESGNDPVHGEPAILLEARPSGGGAKAVNAKDWRSWSPSFGTNAEYGKCKCRGCDENIKACECDKPAFYFPEGVRGSLSNPAQITGVDGVVGTLTNKPAFRAMPPVKAKLTETVKAEDDEPCEMPEAPSDAMIGKESEGSQMATRKAMFKSKVAEAADESFPEGEGHGTKQDAHRSASYAHQSAAEQATGAKVKEFHKDAAAYHDEAAQEHGKVTSKEIVPDTETILAGMPLTRTVDDILLGMTGYRSASAELDAEEDILKACSGVTK